MKLVLKAYTYIIILNCLIGSLFAQTSVAGRVKDSAGIPIEDVLITIKKSNTDGVLYYTHSNSNGSFVIRIQDTIIPKLLIIELNAFGFFKQQHALDTQNPFLQFTLFAAASELAPVLVKDKSIRIKKKGDTLNYSVSSFSNNADKVIGDVIKKTKSI